MECNVHINKDDSVNTSISSIHEFPDNISNDYVLLNNKNKNRAVLDNCISYYYTNIDQLAIKSTCKLDELKNIANEENPDLIGVTEILSKNNTYNDITAAELNIDGYDCFYQEDLFERGTVLYMKKNLNGRMFNDFYEVGFKESTWATFNTNNNENILVGCVYRRGMSTDENSEKLNTILNHDKMNSFDRVLIAGDFNFPNINWQLKRASDQQGETFIEALNDAYLIQHITKPTRVRINQKSNILDLVLTRDIDDVQLIEYCSAIGHSDHLFIKIFTTIPKTTQSTNDTYMFDYNKGNYANFNSYMMEEDWKILNDLDVEEGWLKLKNKILCGTDAFIPKVKLKNKKPKPPWMTIEVKKSIKTKYKLFKRYLDSNNSFYYKQYIAKRNETSKIIKKLKKGQERKIAEDCRSNPKAFWRFVNSKRKCKQGISVLKKPDGTYTTNDREKAEVLDNLFSSVFTRENTDSIPHTVPGEKSDRVFISDIIITEKAVKDKLNKLNTAKTPGIDKIHPRVLKELSESLIKPLTILFNKSICEGQLPLDWKTANISAIFKKGEKSDANNYRPVSLTSIVCKVLESIIRDTVQEYFEQQNLYTQCQHGFRKNKSCTSQLIEVMEEFTTYLDDKDTFDVIYLDFKKAFDSVPHVRLLNKLEAYGITGKIHSWIKGFLTNRMQKVRVGDSESKCSKVISGIPQGSILGPILFTIFINDLPECISGLCKIFADDTKIYNKSSERLKIQEDLDSVNEWSQAWQLPFNNSKCKCLHYGNNNPQNTYFLSGHEIQTCSQEKDLGITFDSDLKFKIHISNITSKANQVLGIIKRNFKFLDKNTFITLYKALVRPHLEYGQSVWSPYLITYKRDIEKVQRRATKLLPKLRNLCYEDRLVQLNLPSLNYRRIRGDLIQVYKMTQSGDFENMFNLSTNVTRGHNFKLKKEYNRLEVRKNSFSQRVVDTWNSLKYQTVNSKNVNEFKKRIDDELLDLKYVYD